MPWASCRLGVGVMGCGSELVWQLEWQLLGGSPMPCRAMGGIRIGVCVQGYIKCKGKGQLGLRPGLQSGRGERGRVGGTGCPAPHVRAMGAAHVRGG